MTCLLRNYSTNHLGPVVVTDKFLTGPTIEHHSQDLEMPWFFPRFYIYLDLGDSRLLIHMSKLYTIVTQASRKSPRNIHYFEKIIVER